MNYKDLFSLSGKNIIVTGACGILGTEFCHGLASFGSNVILLDLDESKVSQNATLLKEKYGIEALGYKCDVSNKDEVNEVIDLAVKKMGGIDGLVNNAAIKANNLQSYFAPFEKYSLDTWKEVSSVNIDGMFLVAQKVGSHMKLASIKGTIIQTSSIYGLLAPDQRIYDGAVYLNHNINTPAVYSATKSAVLGLTRYLATYWASDGIRANSITPGGIESGQNEQFKTHYSNRIPMGRMAQRTELVGALIFLASEASSYITGQNIIVDGGLSAW